MGARTYWVLAAVGPDRLGEYGYLAEVVAGHRNVAHLFAFGDTEDAALTNLARTITVTLERSRFDLSGFRAIGLLVSPATIRLPLQPGEGA